jgi:molybdenum cofactor cytidylyltransferase
MNSHFAVVIPAAGLSGRMGRDKMSLLHHDGQSFAEHLIKSYLSAGCEPIVLVINNTSDISGIKSRDFLTVINHRLDLGRSYSIHLGLQIIPSGISCFIQNIDNPFSGQALLKSLMYSIDDDSYVVPVHENKGGHPLLLGKNLTSQLRNLVDLADFREELGRFHRIEVPFMDKRILWNINTPEDYHEFLAKSSFDML